MGFVLIDPFGRDRDMRDSNKRGNEMDRRAGPP